MGLNTTYGCYDGSYGSFNRFRYLLGLQIGISMYDYMGFGKPKDEELTVTPHELMPLFNHSNCDGELSTDECKSIVKGLDKILDNFNDKLETDYGFKETIIKFRNGCLKAIENNDVVKFE